MPFLVLPDHPAAATVLKRLPEAKQLTVLTHHSRRPWIVGRWSAADAMCASAARNRAVIFGPTTMDVATLTARLRNVRGVRELDALAESLPGTFHLIASIDGEVRFQGSLSTARHVFHTTVDGMTVATDRPQTLAALSGAGIDEEVIALRLLSLWPPGPLIERCVWRGVQSPPMGHHLLVRPDGTAHTRQWWTPPPPEIPLAEAAPVLREALIEGIEARRRANGLLSADLSGGMDSTSLCFIAAHRDVPLFTVRFQPLDPANDDDRWASLCESELPGIDHVVIPGSQGPDWYARPRIGDWSGC
jgi:asparagine synthase (glutamine-hydrolysing)